MTLEKKTDTKLSCSLLIELLIEGLGRASPIEEPEACIYGYGAVRFLASMSMKDSDETNASSSGKVRSKTVSQRLVRQGVMQLMILHLQILNEFVSSYPRKIS